MARGRRPDTKAARTLRALLHLLPEYGGAAAVEKRRLLAELAALQFDRAAQLTALQRIVCFVSAFPDDAAVHRAARRLAGGFAARVARLPRAQRERLDDSGMAGTVTRHVYAVPAARWMQRRFSGSADIDWAADNAVDAVAALIQPLLDPMEAEVVDLSSAGLRRWLAQANSDTEGTDLAWLLAQAGAGRARRQFDQIFDAAEVPLSWTLDDRAGITGNVLRAPVRTREAGMRRASGDTRTAILRPLPLELLSRREAAKLLDVWRAALWSRTRTVFQIEQPNLDECWLADLGHGLRFAAIGVTPERRGALEATYGHLLLANGMPIGYGGFTALFAQVNTGINVFPEYRGSEAAFAFEQALRAMHALTGNARFIVNPYQFGKGNDEALASGAYWFYDRLGFRPAQPEVRALAEREGTRLRAERGYRVPIATLRRLAACDIHLDLADDAAEQFFDEAWLPRLAAGVTAAVAREGTASRAEALTRMSKRLAGVLGVEPSRWSAVERRGFAQFAPILAQIDDLASWPRAERKALAQIVRARWAAQEREFVAAMRAHERLRAALAEVAQRPAARDFPPGRHG
jgi:hypothetical protein